MKKKAQDLIKKKYGNQFYFGKKCFSKIETILKSYKQPISIILGGLSKQWGEENKKELIYILEKNAIKYNFISGSRPNSPFEDVFRIALELKENKPATLLTVGGGSTIDSAKAALAYYTLEDQYHDINEYFGINKVSEMLKKTNRVLIPHIVAITASGSGTHLTRYSNITNTLTNQKLLMIDDVLTPNKAIFDYSKTLTSNKNLTMDGALDGISHCLEVYMGYAEEKLLEVEDIALTGIELIVNNIKGAIANLADINTREALGLGTDLGGAAIMIGGTNGAHLNSFSLVDIISHGRACAILNPYYVIFFSEVIEQRIKKVLNIYYKAGYCNDKFRTLSGRYLGITLALAMQNLSKDIGFPTTLSEIPKFTDKHITQCLCAAKNPLLESKLKNMPVQLSAKSVDEYMKPLLYAAKTGDFSLIKSPIKI